MRVLALRKEEESGMAISVRGVVARGKGEEVEVPETVVPEPGPGEALVNVQACGVCHTDLHYKMGGIGDDYPYLLGHEAAGVVEAVGDDVTEVAPGDFVILNWRADTAGVAAGQRTKPPPAPPPATAGLLGCGVMAGLGAAINTAGVTRGDSVAVIGCGGGGNAAILRSVLAGARKVIAVDVDDRKLEWARGFGATDTVNSQSADPVEKIRDLTDGNG